MMSDSHVNKRGTDRAGTDPRPEAAAGAIRLSDRPVFVVASPRSGTTLMCQMLDAHPNLFAPYWETGLFVRFAEMMSNHLAWIFKEHRASMPLEREDVIAWIRESVQGLFARFAAACGKSRWAEKTPAHVFHMDLIHEVFPGAQFIHMIRNGRDVVRSLQNMPWAPRQIRWSARRWVDSVRAGRDYGRRLPAGQYTEIRYEELVAEPEQTIRRLCEFLGEPYSERMLAFHEPANNSWNYPFRPLEPGPISTYRPLRLVEGLVFRRYAGILMRELGYT